MQNAPFASGTGRIAKNVRGKKNLVEILEKKGEWMPNSLIELAESQDGVLYIEQVEEWIESVVEELEERMFEAEVYNDEFDGVKIGNLLCFGDVYIRLAGKGGVDNAG